MSGAGVQWYYAVGSERRGPYDEAQFAAMVQSGAIGPASLVWCTGMGEWMPFAQTPMGQAGAGQPAGAPPAMAPGGSMGFVEAVSTCFAKYATFSGRAARPEYWFFFLFAILCSIAASVVDMILVGMHRGFSPIQALFGLAILLPGLAVTVRRLHDTDKSAWWLLIVLVPMVGSIVLLVFMFLRGSEGRNRYG